MMTTYWKAVRPDGFDFYSGTVRWLPPAGEPLPEGGLVVRHPARARWVSGTDAYGYLSVSTVATDCTGMRWPCRLAVVEPVRGHGVHAPEPEGLPHKRASVRWRVVEEVEAHLTLGPHGAEVAAIIERARRLTADEATRLSDAWLARSAASAARSAASAARSATWRARSAALVAARGAASSGAAWSAASVAASVAASGAASGAAWAAAWAAARAAASDAASGALVRDLITDEQYQTLAGPWLSAIGEVQS